MKANTKKIIGGCALGALSIVEILQQQVASATPVNFTGSTQQNPRGGNVQVVITVDGASGTYRITGISTPVQPTGQNASYASFAIPTLTSEALAAQSAAITGVTGASEISAAWKASLSSAIAAAAAGGETIGHSSVVVTPTPTPTPTATTPAPTPTPTSTATTPAPVPTSPGITPAPGPTSVAPSGAPAPLPIFPTSDPAQVALPAAGGQVLSIIPSSIAVPPVFQPYLVGPYMGNGGNSANLSSYVSAVASAINAIGSASSQNRAAAISSAQSALGTLQSVMGAVQAANSNGVLAYIASLNSAMQNILNTSNQQFSDYYYKVAVAANQLYADAQAAAAAIKASPAPTVTVTVTPTPTVPEVTIQAGSTILIKAGSVIKKKFTCLKNPPGPALKKIMSAVIVKCPTGFKLLKK